METSASFEARLAPLLYSTPFEPAIQRLQTIVGVGRRSAEVIVSEIGVDMSRFSTAGHTRKSYLGAQFRRISKRLGLKRAGIAVAHSILVIVYHMLHNGVDFNDLGADYFDRMNTAKLKRYHLRRLAELGYDVSKLTPAA